MTRKVGSAILLSSLLLCTSGCGKSPDATALQEVPVALKKMETSAAHALGSPYANRKVKNTPELRVSFLNLKIEKTNTIDAPFKSIGEASVWVNWVSDDGKKEWTYYFGMTYTLDTDPAGHPNWVSLQRKSSDSEGVFPVDPNGPKLPDGSNKLLDLSEEQQRTAILFLRPAKSEDALFDLVDQAAQNWKKASP